MSKPFDGCECDHLATDHAPEGKGPCVHEDCTCRVYIWDRDLGGVAVTHQPKAQEQFFLPFSLSDLHPNPPDYGLNRNPEARALPLRQAVSGFRCKGCRHSVQVVIMPGMR